jgi:hypothetical protein
VPALPKTSARPETPAPELDHRAHLPASGDTCVYVVGMHRSGTSATAGLLSHLGLGAPKVDDLLRETPGNVRGNWESTSLNLFDERLLNRLGGNWLAPPALPPGWQNDSALDSLKAEAFGLFAAAFGPRPIVWKDPRVSIVLPFWRTIVRSPAAAIFVYRDPSEVAASLHARDKLRTTHALALWERYLRSAAANLDGIPTFVLSYASLLESPDKWCDEIVAFLTDVSITIDRSRVPHATGWLDHELRHERATDAGPTLPGSVADLLRDLNSLEGPHHPWAAPDLGAEPAWVDDILAIWFELCTFRYQNSALYSSRPLRWARRLHKVIRTVQQASYSSNLDVGNHEKNE